jgi:hypothetical protein
MPVTIGNGIKALLRFGFFIIAVCTVLDCLLFVALGYRYAKIVLYPVDPAKLETPSTYINFDLLYRNGTKTSSQFPPIRALPRALAQVSSKEPDRVYPQWPVSFLAPYGSVPQNDRRLLVDPEVNLRGGGERQSNLSENFRSPPSFSSARWTTGWRTAASCYDFLRTALTWRWRMSGLVRSTFGASL